ncbi:MAG: hypothetical protein EU531_11425 [Promethearchaeota archaeon]|nr:MAG: hypothetical protein EU531_11425 [Candidatus Lokiarchaeota archaeon]
MCEFKIIKKNDGSQIGEDITILGYTEKFELVLRDILGAGEVLDSALIFDVNTLNQTTTVVEHPLIKDFLKLIINLNDNTITKMEIENFQTKLNEIKQSL